MPEVVYATPDSEGNARNWDDVFPIYRVDAQNTEWRCINNTLENIAVNNRFGGKSVEELKTWLAEDITKRFEEEIQKNLESLKALPNVKPDKCIHCGNSEWMHSEEDKPDHKFENGLTQEHKDLLDARKRWFASYGEWRYYIDKVFENLGGAYREYK